MNDHSEVLDLIAALAAAREIFREIHIFMEETNLFSDVSTAMIPFSSHSSIFDSRRMSINFAINGELKAWVDHNKKAFGLSLVLCHSDGQWSLESGYGWSGQEVGWDPIQSSDMVFATTCEMIASIEVFAINLRSSGLEFMSTI